MIVSEITRSTRSVTDARLEITSRRKPTYPYSTNALAVRIEKPASTIPSAICLIFINHAPFRFAAASTDRPSSSVPPRVARRCDPRRADRALRNSTALQVSTLSERGDSRVVAPGVTHDSCNRSCQARDGLRVNAQAKRIPNMNGGLEVPATGLAMPSAEAGADPAKTRVAPKSQLQWWGGALGAAIALADALMLKWFGVNLTSHGHDVMWPVVAWFGVWFAVLGFMLGKTLDDRQRARASADLIRAQMRELAASRERLLQSEKLAALGTLAAAIAHEVRNPLAVIRSAAQSLAEAAPCETAETLRSCRFMMEEADRLANLVNSLLAFARPARLTAQAVTAAELFDRALLLARGPIESRQVRIERREPPRSAVASADPNLIAQVLAGLLTNAAQAAPFGGEVRIESRSVDSTVELAVEDSGPGVPAALRDRIFEPFFTTRPSGVGLGLAIARQITEAHGGSIRLDQSSSGGARFSVVLPRAKLP